LTLYNPPQFKEDDVAALHAALRENGFGSLVTLGADGLEASHVPMLIDPAPAPYGTLIGHIARANPQWRTARPDVPALAMFLGPNAYITPAWYPTKHENGKVVPTWNYTAIHASGTLTFFEDPERLLALVTRLTEHHEAKRAEPWAVSDAPADYVQGMLKGIVGFELAITRLEGKWKMSQNRPAADRAGVVEGLTREGGPSEAKVAKIVTGVNRAG
jgi:transcriptional regulator